jgi:hypothetical protein
LTGSEIEPKDTSTRQQLNINTIVMNNDPIGQQNSTLVKEMMIVRKKQNKEGDRQEIEQGV